MSTAKVPKVRLVRVTGQAQRYAAHSVDDNELLGYCGRDGVITHPAGSTAKGTLTKIMEIADPRLSRQGLQRSLETIKNLSVRPERLHNPDAPGPVDPKWKEINRREVGLYATPKEGVSGPGWETGGYFCIIYEITEKLDSGAVPEIRVRVAEGKPCRMMGEGYQAFVSLFAAYLAHAREHDEGLHVPRSLRCFERKPETRPANAVTKAPSTLPALLPAVASAAKPGRKKRLASSKPKDGASDGQR